jgi:type IV secretion system protein VirB10
MSAQGPDPRAHGDGAAGAGRPLEALRPKVAGVSAGPSTLLVLCAAGALGIVAFLGLSAHRLHAHDVSQPAGEAGAGASGGQMIAAPPPPEAVDALARQAQSPPAPAVAPPPAPPPQVAAIRIPMAPAPAPETDQSLRTSALVVDLTRPEPTLAPAAPAAGASRPGAGGPRPGTAGSESADERFRDRVAEAEPDRARASMLRNQKTLLPQGTLIPAVLETALNSDLPGFARAVVSRDVSSFDGARVLVPRGSRVIGEYKSALAQGQSRAFVIWTRIIRPDGASIQIGSGGGDTLGRAGLSGSVDTHFLERFSGAVLLTVLNAGANAVAGVPSTEVVIGSSQQAAGLAGSASAFAPASIPPTIKVAQGTPVLIFVAKDLDFSAVEARPQ